MNVGDYIKKLRISKGYSQEQLGSLVGVQRAAVQKWECGKVQNLKRETIHKLANIFGVSPSSFIVEDGEYIVADDIFPVPTFVKKPRLGTIACGEPITAEQNIEAYDNVPENIKCDFTLKCKGDSMIDARIMDGDIVYIKEQPMVENGQIAAVLIGDEATLKRVYISDGTVTLLPCNAKYAPMVYSGEDLNNIKIIGKAVGFTSVIE